MRTLQNSNRTAEACSTGTARAAASRPIAPRPRPRRQAATHCSASAQDAAAPITDSLLARLQAFGEEARPAGALLDEVLRCTAPECKFSSELWTSPDAATLHASARSWRQRAQEVAPDYAEALRGVDQLERGQISVKWRARWFPRQLQWLDRLGKAVPGWRVEYHDLLSRYDVRSQFKWRSLFRLFAHAARTGVLRLPESAIEGRWLLRLDRDSQLVQSISESVWLIPRFQALQVKNRRVARDMLQWLEIRQPADMPYGEWDRAFMASLRIDDVPGMGQFDVDGLDDAERSQGYADAFAAIGFATVIVLTFGIAYGLVHVQQHVPDLALYDAYDQMYDLTQ